MAANPKTLRASRPARVNRRSPASLGARPGRLSGAVALTPHGIATNALQRTAVFIPANSQHGQRGPWGTA